MTYYGLLGLSATVCIEGPASLKAWIKALSCTGWLYRWSFNGIADDLLVPSRVKTFPEVIIIVKFKNTHIYIYTIYNIYILKIGQSYWLPDGRLEFEGKGDPLTGDYYDLLLATFLSNCSPLYRLLVPLHAKACTCNSGCGLRSYVLTCLIAVWLFLHVQSLHLSKVCHLELRKL